MTLVGALWSSSLDLPLQFLDVDLLASFGIVVVPLAFVQVDLEGRTGLSAFSGPLPLSQPRQVSGQSTS